MKRDMELIRKILLETESADDGTGRGGRFTIEGVDNARLYGHFILLDEAGLIEGINSRTIGSSDYIPRRLTWSGHEFLDSIRDPKIWSDTKKKLGEVSGATSLEVIKAIAVGLAKQALGLP